MRERSDNSGVHKLLLAELGKWRDGLARDIAAHPPNRRVLTDALLNESVQRILDRIVFLRICEAKEIEAGSTLLAAVRDWNERPNRSLYSILNERFAECRTRYGSLLYGPHQCEQLEVSDDIILKILEGLHHPLSPYQFNELGVDVLGCIYEEFLSQTIHLTPTSIRVVEKPDVRKAGGVFYTPRYIVDFIVENTVGRLLYGRSDAVGQRELKLTPDQVSKLKIMDMACGSGSFLLGVYRAMIDYHAKWYAKNPGFIETREHIPDAYIEPNGTVRLSSRMKRDILVNNIFGVDTDRQAVEVTQMSLYLKMLEDLPRSQQPSTFSEDALPELTANIKCGNSLIGSDVSVRQNASAARANQMINAFDWQSEFSEIMNRGGFDCVIGNPPYGATLGEHERTYLTKRFNLQTTDTAALMMRQANCITHNGGLAGFIIPKSFTYASNWRRTREFMLTDLELVADCGKVWKNVKLEQVIYVATKGSHATEYSSYVRCDEEFRFVSTVRKESCSKFGFIVNGLAENEIDLATKLQATGPALGRIAVNRRGGGFQTELRRRGPINVLGGKQIGRYSLLLEPKGYVGRGTKIDGKSRIRPNSVLVQNIVAHIQNPKDHIKIIATVVPETESGKYLILDTINQLECTNGYSNKFVLGILCSRLMNWFVYRFVFAKAIRTMHFDAVVTDRLPIPSLDLSSRQGKATHDRLVALVDQMLDLNRQLKQSHVDDKQKSIKLQIALADEKIDAIVFALYGLTNDEIQIVEGEP